jgi:hypothetical protein
MQLHANSALSLKGRRRLCRLVVDENWTLKRAAAASSLESEVSGLYLHLDLDVLDVVNDRERPSLTTPAPAHPNCGEPGAGGGSLGTPLDAAPPSNGRGGTREESPRDWRSDLIL